MKKLNSGGEAESGVGLRVGIISFQNKSLSICHSKNHLPMHPAIFFCASCPLKTECYLWAMYSRPHMIIFLDMESSLMSNPEGDAQPPSPSPALVVPSASAHRAPLRAGAYSDGTSSRRQVAFHAQA